MTRRNLTSGPGRPGLRRRRQRRWRDDDGAVLVVTSVVLVALLVFSAFAVDLGAVASARRADQGAVDAATMAGAIDLANGRPAAEIAATVISYAERDLGVTPGSLDWDSCTGYVDPAGDDAVWVEVDGYDCILRSGARLLVRLPEQRVDSVFGVVVDRAGYSHRAFAVAGSAPVGYGQVLPFGLQVGATGHVCLRTDNPSSPVSPCTGSVTGDSGLLNFGLFGNEALGTPVSCNGNGSGSNGRAANNIAAGADHPFGLTPVPNTSVVDTDRCPDATPPAPVAADTINGAGNSGVLSSGLFAGTRFHDGKPARLKREALTPYASPPITVEGHEVDDTPLWAFIGEDLTDVPNACRRTQFEEALASSFGSAYASNSIPDEVEAHLAGLPLEVRMERMLERCFSLYTYGRWDDGGAFRAPGPANEPGEVVTETECGAPPAGSRSSRNPRCRGPVFTANSQIESPEIWDIQLVPRFGYVPVVHEPLGANRVSFSHFQPIYFQRLCIGNQKCNQGTFSPGVGWEDQHGSTKDSVAAVSAFAFPDRMLPGRLAGGDAPHELNVNRFLRLLR